MCLDDQVLTTYIDGELAEPWKTQVEEHLVHCSGCKSRYEQLVILENDIKEARLQEDEFSFQQDRVWQYLENNHLSHENKERFFQKSFSIRSPMILVAAAALVLIFSANFFVVRGFQNKVVPEIPVIGSEVGAGDILAVRATDSAPIAQSLEDLSVEDILKLLDDRGFEVDLRLKSLEVIPADFVSEVITTTMGIDDVSVKEAIPENQILENLDGVLAPEDSVPSAESTNL